MAKWERDGVWMWKRDLLLSREESEGWETNLKVTSTFGAGVELRGRLRQRRVAGFCSGF